MTSKYESDPDIFRLALAGQVIRFHRAEGGYTLSQEDLVTLISAGLDKQFANNIVEAVDNYFNQNTTEKSN